MIKAIDEPFAETINDAWTVAEFTAKCVQISVLFDQFISFAEDDTTAKKIPNKLNETFERKRAILQVSVRRKLTKLKRKTNKSLRDNFTIYEDVI